MRLSLIHAGPAGYEKLQSTEPGASVIDANPSPGDDEEGPSKAEEEPQATPVSEERAAPNGLQRVGAGMLLLTIIGITADLMGIANFDLSEVWFLKGVPSPGGAEGAHPSNIGEWSAVIWAGVLQMRAQAPGWFVALALVIAAATVFGPRPVAIRIWWLFRLLGPLGILAGVGWLLFPWVERWPLWAWWADNWPKFEGVVAFGEVLLVALAAIHAWGMCVKGREEGRPALFVGGIFLLIAIFLAALAMVAWWDGLAWFLKGMQMVECIVIAIAGYATIRGDSAE
jgi:hypothetical protein